VALGIACKTDIRVLSKTKLYKEDLHWFSVIGFPRVVEGHLQQGLWCRKKSI